MPLEIRELIVKATVDGAGGSNTESSGATGGNDTAQQEQIVNLCVEKVLEILKEKSER